MGLQNRDPVLFFEDDLQSLSLHNFMFGQSLPVENDLLELIIRHKSTLTHLHLVEFSVDSEDSQTWSAILQRLREGVDMSAFLLVGKPVLPVSGPRSGIYGFGTDAGCS